MQQGHRMINHRVPPVMMCSPRSLSHSFLLQHCRPQVAGTIQMSLQLQHRRQNQQLH